MQTGKSHKIFQKKNFSELMNQHPKRQKGKKVWRCKNVGFHILSYIFHFWEKENFLDWAERWNYVPAKPLPSEVSVWQTHERRGNFMKSVSHREMWTGEEINQTSSSKRTKVVKIFEGEYKLYLNEVRSLLPTRRAALTSETQFIWKFH